MANPTSALGIAHAILLTIVTIINLASTTIMCLALTFGSGGRFQAVLMGLNGFACLLPAAYWLHKIVFKDDYPFVRSISIFGLLTLIGLELITLLVRHDQEDGLALINDFAMLDHSTRIAKASIALAMLSTFFSSMGFMTAQSSCMSRRVNQNPIHYISSPIMVPSQTKNQLSRSPPTISSSATLVSRTGPSFEGNGILLAEVRAGRFYK